MGEFRVHHVRFFEYQPKPIHCLAYEKKNKQLAVSRSDGSIEIWLPESDWLQEKVISGRSEQSVEAIVWQGKRLFTAGLGGDVTEHNLLTLKPKNSEPCNAGAIWCLTKNFTGTRLAAGTEDGCVVLFDIEMGQLKYLQSFGKQEGRILSIAWHTQEGVIVTGGVDNIRLWSVKSGQAIQRLTLGHQQENQETIVWCLAITSNMTIISGDSRGKTCFWNGRQGTLIKTFSSHKADVLTLSINEEEDCVFSSGVDPLLVGFEFVTTKSGVGNQHWVQSTTQNIHKHDVRAVCFLPNCIVSAGIGTNLCLTQRRRDETISKRIAHIPQNIVHVAKEKKMVMLRYTDYLEVWKLGHTNFTSEKDGEILPLRSNPVKLLQLKCKGQAAILCCGISNSGDHIAYCDEHNLRIYQLSVDEEDYTPKVGLSKITMASEDLRVPIHHLEFTPDGRFIVTATASGYLQLTEINEDRAHVSNTFNVFADGITMLTMSPTGNCVAIVSGDYTISILNITNNTIECNLPKYDHPPRTLRFSPSGEDLVIAYSNNMIFEFDVDKKEYTTWSRRESRRFPNQWFKRQNKVCRITFDPRNDDHLVLQDNMAFVIVDKSKTMPEKKKRIFDKWYKPKKEDAFHQCKKYNFLMYVELLEDDWMLIVERTPLAILNNLPATLKQKKFGT
ncbi:hypothetical protein SNE40_008101 [Patella caerulea]|uniref:Cirhin n=1 Tax=Patella caerulea TaxID=87958 RepID=A0AAN8K0P0_PATCE